MALSPTVTDSEKAILLKLRKRMDLTTVCIELFVYKFLDCNSVRFFQRQVFDALGVTNDWCRECNETQ